MDKRIILFIFIGLLVNLTFFFVIDSIYTPFPQLVGKSISLITNFNFDYNPNPAYYTPDYDLEINNLCTGFATFFLLASIIIIQKSLRLTKNSWKNIAIFLPLSFILLYLINILRLLVILYFGNSQTITETLHIIGWMMMGVTVFLLWMFFEKKNKNISC